METTQTTAEKSSNLNSPEAQKIGRELKCLRILANLNQKELADRCGLKRNTVMAIELGRYNAGIRQITQMADALGYDIKFIKRPENPTIQ